MFEYIYLHKNSFYISDSLLVFSYVKADGRVKNVMVLRLLVGKSEADSGLRNGFILMNISSQ